MGQTLLTGATGRLGAVLAPKLRAAGHDVRPASRSPPADGDGDWVTVDLATGAGIERAVEGVETVVHTASAPTGDTEAVDIQGTERLLSAAVDAGVENVVYVSIVGIDEIPFSYYDAKVTAERAVEDSDVPHTILRATQFHEFVADIFQSLRWLPVWPLPTGMQLQPVAVEAVADVLVDHAVPEARGRMPPMGGPEVHTVGELARTYCDATDRRRPVLGLPVPSSTVRAFRDGEATCPDRAVGRIGWAEWLRDECARSADAPTDSRKTGARADTT